MHCTILYAIYRFSTLDYFQNSQIYQTRISKCSCNFHYWNLLIAEVSCFINTHTLLAYILNLKCHFLYLENYVHMTGFLCHKSIRSVIFGARQ